MPGLTASRRCWSCSQPSEDQTRCAWYGVWLVDLDPKQVPPPVWPLLALARRWGISDDVYRWDSVEAASADELNSIIDAVDSVSDDDLYGWLAGPEAKRLPPTDEYVAVTCLTMAADHARLRVGRQSET